MGPRLLKADNLPETVILASPGLILQPVRLGNSRKHSAMGLAR